MRLLPLCSICGDVVGVYEPLVVLGGDAPHTTSLVNDPRLGDSGDTLAHQGCASPRDTPTGSPRGGTN